MIAAPHTNSLPLTLIDRLSELGGWIAAWLFVGVALAIVYEVISRYLLGAPSIWVEELTLLAQIWATYLGAAYVLRHDGLLRIELLPERLGPRAHRFSRWASLILIALFSLLVVYLGSESLLESLRHGRASASLLVLPNWCVEASLPLGFALLFGLSLVQMRQLARSPLDQEQRP